MGTRLAVIQRIGAGWRAELYADGEFVAHEDGSWAEVHRQLRLVGVALSLVGPPPLRRGRLGEGALAEEQPPGLHLQMVR